MRLYDVELTSRFWLGTAGYPSPQLLLDAVQAARPGLITCSLRRQGQGGNDFWGFLQALGTPLLPNTAGCRTVDEAVNLAFMARELFATNWLKLEITGDDYNLQPDPFALVDATRELSREGFQVFPYMTNDLVLAKKLLDAGAQVLMPWGAPIGSGQGLSDLNGLKALRQRLPKVPMVIDAGIGRPSHACQTMELGFDAVLANTAVAKAARPAAMAGAMARAVDAGRAAFLAGPISARELAQASTPVVGTPFWHQEPQ
ncbi:thiazole synthase [Gallaecimonas xiamenensis]|uniref:thiazole synthase n=1 Tax=Gallaecimonas xiamenensis 3-C-1 TaxID=745411 RepID=K2IWJ1_9GAMM|nr:thiazole synthase [Gallaecimonas xiamenensis]EKE67238.1 thiazole biosynthesis family protein [Gallaecimonas xiamenensis 3-C-1]